jgi:hypothetical protein
MRDQLGINGQRDARGPVLEVEPGAVARSLSRERPSFAICRRQNGQYMPRKKPTSRALRPL